MMLKPVTQRAQDSLYTEILTARGVNPRITYTQSGNLTYFNSAGVLSTAAVDTMVLDYDPATLAVKGYPFWEARTNSLRTSVYTDPTNGAIAAAGSELITNGLLTVDATGWTNKSTGTGTTAWSSGGIAIAGGAAGVGSIEQSFTVAAGVVYTLIFTGETNSFTAVKVGTTSGASDVFSQGTLAAANRHYTFTPAATGTVFLQFQNSANTTANLYAISCRQQALPLNLRQNVFSLTGRSLFTISAVAAVNGVPTFDLRYQTPVTGSSGTGSYIYLETGTQITAATADNWTLSAYLAIPSGTLTNITLIACDIEERTSGGGGVSSKTGSDIKGALTTSIFPRTSFSTTLTGGGTVARVQPAILIAQTAGALVDVTLRIGLPNMQLGAFPTADVQTTSVAVTRAAPSDSFALASIWNASQNSGVVTFVQGTTVAGTRPIVSFDDGTANNQIRIYTSGTSLVMTVTTAGVSRNIAVGTVAANTQYKVAWRAQASNNAAVMTGGTVQTDISGTMPVVTTGRLGLDFAGNVQNGWQSNNAIYQTALPNATLLSLVA